MKRVGVITLFHGNNNYGAVLQAYALQKAIQKMGGKADVIDTIMPYSGTDALFQTQLGGSGKLLRLADFDRHKVF